METDNNAKSTNEEQPAFPVDRDRINMNHIGLTKREYFAAMAMQGMLSSGLKIDMGNPTEALNRLINNSVIISDQLRKKLNDH